ncbi:hypothetical protein K505DRAFT_115599 [Melanomma pulvis-pyrius CBS 109.77]|uniref:Uncharacterized protein n=1 Tax=Melanomma pulvis-pyrius CBS 109.77 TaxID=1314802 RepID=A0A6A6WWP3_9PLEO|nr:hypothetical protein K505DRAFT_115599 [Melanomma pulvis-pyrius CBS 109.77]
MNRDNSRAEPVRHCDSKYELEDLQARKKSADKHARCWQVARSSLQRLIFSDGTLAPPWRPSDSSDSQPTLATVVALTMCLHGPSPSHDTDSSQEPQCTSRRAVHVRD